MMAPRLRVGLTNHRSRLSLDQLAPNKRVSLAVHMSATESACNLEEGHCVKCRGTVIYFESVQVRVCVCV